MLQLYSQLPVVCPYCLSTSRHHQDLRHCPCCQRTIPANYVTAQRNQPLAVARVVGDDIADLHHYQQAMTNSILELGKKHNQPLLHMPLLPHTEAISAHSANYSCERRLLRQNHEMDLFSLSNMYRWRGRTVAMHYQQTASLYHSRTPDQARSETRMPMSVILISLDDILNGDSKTFYKKLEAICGSVIVASRRQDNHPILVVLQVVLSTVVKPNEHTALPRNVRQYLLEDDLFAPQITAERNATYTNLDYYVERMQHLSAFLQEWVINQTFNERLEALIVSLMPHLYFSVTTWGHQQIASEEYQFLSYRMLDALFWIFELQSVEV